jgi:hypothetical protein
MSRKVIICLLALSLLVPLQLAMGLTMELMRLDIAEQSAVEKPCHGEASDSVDVGCQGCCLAFAPAQVHALFQPPVHAIAFEEQNNLYLSTPLPEEPRPPLFS